MINFLILAPMLLMFLQFLVLGGRVANTQGAVQSAAREGARQASIASGPSSAATVIGPVAEASLASRDANCPSPIVTLGPATNYVQGGAVEVVVTCEIPIADLDLLGMPGTFTVTRSALEPIEKYRVIEP